VNQGIYIAEPSDAREILALQKRAYQSEAVLYNDFSIPPLMQTLEELEHEFSDHVFLALKLEQQIIASARVKLEHGTAFIGRLIVHPDFQRQGLGTQLMQQLEQRWREDIERFELFTGHNSTSNLRLYEKLGYQEFKRQTVNDHLILVYLEKRRQP
jgi:ribosomal protein S18 acetylase RimI-like enzyme